MDASVRQRIYDHLAAIYSDLPGEQINELCGQVESLIQRHQPRQTAPAQRWSEQTALVISYADSIQAPDRPSLQALDECFQQYFAPEFTTLHVLPFCTASSDDGFSVVHYRQIPPEYGDWSDIRRLASHTQLMGDVVLNHCSQHSHWFQAFLAGEPAYQNYFFEPGPDFDISQVVRPRPQPVLQTYADGREVWATFSADQVDLNYREPAVLLAMLDTVLFYLDQGVRLFRLDAVAFLWKQSGTGCINLPETHEVIRLIRTLTDAVASDAVIITETNLPNQENLSYFGNGNEAHWVYNFSLPPLACYSLLTGDSAPLRRWAMSLPPAWNDMTYLNFLASHDGIGLRPTEGLLTDEQFQGFVGQLQANGAHISMRTKPDGEQAPYEANITLYSALERCEQDPEGQYAFERFIAAHAIMFAVEGVPAVYINSLLGARNWDEGVSSSGIPRRINREKFQLDAVAQAFDDPESHPGRVLRALRHLLAVRTASPAFHPNATQFTLQLPPAFFGLWRQSLDRRSNLFAITNVTAEHQSLPLSALNIITGQTWHDALTGERICDTDSQLVFAPYQSRWVGV